MANQSCRSEVAHSAASTGNLDDPSAGTDSLYAFRSRDVRTVTVVLAFAACWILVAYVYRGGLVGGLVSVGEPTSVAYHSKIDPNRCEWPELCLLPNIGPVLARRIVAERAAGQYDSVDDLKRVRGIGPRSVERLGRWLYFSDESATAPNDMTVIGSLE